MTMLSDAELHELRKELVELYARFRRLESSIEMEHIVLSALLSNFPDDSSGQLIAGASAATTSKAEMRARIEKWNVQETGLRNRILDIEHQLPVHAKTNAPLNLVKRPT